MRVREKKTWLTRGLAGKSEPLEWINEKNTVLKMRGFRFNKINFLN